MLGTLVNTAAVIAGSAAGLLLGPRLPDRVRDILTQALGLSVLYVGIEMSLKGTNALLTIGCVILGGLTGELLNLEAWMEKLAEWLKKRLGSASPFFVDGFVTATVMYLVGPMMILGCIADGVAGDSEILFIKSLFDGVASVALASSLGLGVLFSAGPVLFVQGAFTLGASYLLFMQEPAILEAVTSTGGILIMSIGINLLDLKKIRTGNLLPALFYAVIGAMFLS